MYSDLGDYPTALRYYQQALDNPGHAPESDDLRSRLNTQTGMLLEQLRLYDQAIPYFEEVLNRKMQERDSAGIVYTLQRLGGIYYNSALQDVSDSVRCRNLDKADSLLTLSLDYSETLPGTFPAMSRVWLAGVRMEKGDSETALGLVRHTPEEVKPISRNVALAFAAEVYLECGVLDSAYMYARQLIASQDMTNKRSGYRLLLYPELRSLIHPDTLNQYYEDYRNILEGYFDENRNTQALMQDSRYNYDLHKRESLAAHNANERMLWVIIGCMLVISVLAFAILYAKYRNKSNILRLQQALDSLEILKRQLENEKSKKWAMDKAPKENSSEYDRSDDDASRIETVHKTKPVREQDLLEEVRNSMMELYRSSSNHCVPALIRDSEVYAEIQDTLQSRKRIDDEAWERLETVVLTVSPDFINRLELLTQNRLTKADRQIALLIKSGFRPSDMTVLLTLSNGAVISRRNSLGRKLLGRSESAEVINGIIRSL